MINRKISIVLPFVGIFGKSLASEGCEDQIEYKCGDKCSFDKECHCGGTIFKMEDSMWCCHSSPCISITDEYGWEIAVQCNGTALNLTQPCNQKCNFYPDDEFRNKNHGHGAIRSHVPCKSDHMNVTQCIPEPSVSDGRCDCKNRADESPFKYNIGNSSSPLIDLDNVLKPCGKGFKCSGGCQRMVYWCDPSRVYSCEELAGKTTTGETFGPVMCRNQTFWEPLSCGREDFYRCTGDKPGQCVRKDDKCLDGSSEIKPAQGGDCGKDLKCKGRRHSWWEGLDVCIEEQYRCYGIDQCNEKEDEIGCNNDPTYCYYENCDKYYKAPMGGHCEGDNDLVCTARSGRWAGRSICVGEKFQCDNYVQ